MNGARIVYDDQAGVFESRAGLPETVAVQVAEALHRYAGPGGLVVEIGAGTGEIGQWLAAESGRYVGLDSSRAMLGVFRPRLPQRRGVALLHADADADWPIRSGSAAVIFGSRVLHLLEPERVLAQARRVARRSGAVLACGRVAHDPDSPRATARRKLRELLAGHGLQPRPTGGRPTRLFALAQAAGYEPVPEQVVATWPETVSLSQVLAWWRSKTSIGGVNPPAPVAAAVRRALAAWAADRDPDTPVTTRTRYLLEGVRLFPDH